TAVSVEDLEGNERYTFAMGDTVRFRVSFTTHAALKGLAVFIAFRSGLSREILTSARHVITEATVPEQKTSTVIIDLPDIYMRPGEYPIYIHVADAGIAPRNYDVLDDLTPPLVIEMGERALTDNFDPAKPVGFFSLPST